MDQPSWTPPPVPPPVPPAAPHPVPPVAAQAGPALPATVFRVPPPAPEPPKKKSVLGVLAVCALMGVGLMGFVGKVALKRLGRARDVQSQLRSGTLSPYDLASREYSRNPSKFRTGAVRGAERGMRKNVPRATFEFDDAAQVDDLGKALRTVITYRGTIPSPEGEVAVRGQLRQYVHPHGMVMVETACFATYSMCLEIDELSTKADERVLANLGAQNTSRMVPPEAECQSSGAGGFGRETTICRVGEDNVLTFQNLSLAETVRELQRSAADPANRDLQ